MGFHICNAAVRNILRGSKARSAWAKPSSTDSGSKDAGTRNLSSIDMCRANSYTNNNDGDGDDEGDGEGEGE